MNKCVGYKTVPLIHLHHTGCSTHSSAFRSNRVVHTSVGSRALCRAIIQPKHKLSRASISARPRARIPAPARAYLGSARTVPVSTMPLLQSTRFSRCRRRSRNAPHSPAGRDSISFSRIETPLSLSRARSLSLFCVCARARPRACVGAWVSANVSHCMWSQYWKRTAQSPLIEKLIPPFAAPTVFTSL